MRCFLIFISIFVALSSTIVQAKEQKILNVSYDVSRELFIKINAAFIPYYKTQSGIDLVIDQSHAGSSRQARSILEGLQASVVTFNQVPDITILVKNGFVAQDWQQKFPNHASPYYSFPTLLVRSGNPKNIHSWDDLIRDDIHVIFANPKTSGNGRYAYLAAYSYAKDKYQSDEKAIEFIGKIIRNVPVFDTGSRGATTSFIERNLGDVLITFESENIYVIREFGKDQFEIIIPEVSLRAEFPVAIVDRVVDRLGTREAAQAYLSFLYSKEGQRILAESGNRPIDADIAAEFSDSFPQIRLLNVEELLGSWDEVQKTHFSNGGLFDSLMQQR